MKRTDMPPVAKCEITDCAYNRDTCCHARAITIGGSADHPACDTYFRNPSAHTHLEPVAGVGACKVTACAYNEDFECSARAIRVSRGVDAADCLTFSPR